MLDSVPAIQERRTIDSAKNVDGSPKMTGNGLMVDTIYNQRDYSSLLTFNRKIFMNQENNIGKKFQETHPSNVAYDRIVKDFTTLNRYSYGDQYDAHFDYASFSAITFFSLSKKEMLGGELVFTDYDISFKFVDNFCVIFPSWVQHHATKVESKDVFRYSLSQFGVIDYI